MKKRILTLLATAAALTAPIAWSQSTPPVLINNITDIIVSDGTIGPVGDIIVMTSGGSNYNDGAGGGPPTVTITGGGGFNAAAIPLIDDASGQVTGLQITNSGYGYITPPTVTISGGYVNPVAPATTPTLSSGAAADGPLYFPNAVEFGYPFLDFIQPDQNESYGPAGFSIGIYSVALGTDPVGGFQFAMTVNGLSIGETTPSVPEGEPAGGLWTPPLPGIYSIVTTTSDGNGNTAVSPAIRYFALGTAIVSSEAGGNSSSPPGTLVPQGSSITLQAASTVQQGFVKQVDFYTDWDPNTGTTGPGGGPGSVSGSGTLIGTGYAYPYNVIYTPQLTPAATHLVKAVAWDSNGNAVPTYETPALITPDEVYITAAAANPLSLPTCVIVTPSANSLVEMPAGGSSVDIDVSAAAGIQAPAGTNITKVEVYINGVLLSTQTTAPYQFKWTPTVTGIYKIVALAYDNQGNVVAASSVSSSQTPVATTVTIESQPTVAITSPAAQASLSNTNPVTVRALVTDTNLDTGGNPATISQVQFFQGTTLVGTATVPVSTNGSSAASGYTYQVSFFPTVAPGNFNVLQQSNISAVATDDLGFTGSSSQVPVNVSVTQTSGNGTVIANPASGPVPVGSAVVLLATSTPTSGSLQQIDYYTDWNSGAGTTGQATSSGPTTGSVNGSGTYLGSVYSSPYSLIYTPAGAAGTSHVVMALAWDSNGNYIPGLNGQDQITLTMENPVSNGSTQTTCSIVSPATGSYATIGPINVDVSAGTGPNGVISKVELYVNGALNQSTITYPYDFTYTPTVTGVYSFTALAYDNHGNVVASTTSTSSNNLPSPTIVTVESPPAVAITSPAAGATLVSGSAATVQAVVRDTNLDQYGNPVTVTSVNFYQDGILIGTATSPITGSLYQIAFLASPHLSGGIPQATSTLTAVATDSVGITGSSQGVTVVVSGTNTGGEIGTLIASPASSNVTVGSAVAIKANSVALSGRIGQIDFYTDWNPASGTTGRAVGGSAGSGPVTGSGTYLGTSYSSPYSIIYAPAGSGGATHLVKAVAWDANGNPVPGIGTEDEITLTMVSAVPGSSLACSIATPVNNSQIQISNKAIDITVDASTGSSGIVSKVELYVNGALFATDTVYPYNFAYLPTATGVYSLTAIAYDNLGDAVASSASPSYTNTPTPTVVTVTAASVVVGSNSGTQISVNPASGDVAVGSSVVLAATSSSPTGIVEQIDYYTDWNAGSGTTGRFAGSGPVTGPVTGSGTYVGTGYASSHGVFYTPAGAAGATHLVKALAWDSAGNYIPGGGTDELTLTMEAAAAGQLPSCTIVSPLPNSIAQVGPIPVSVSAGAGPNAVITKVEGYVNGALYVTISAYPYNFTFSPTVTGVYSIEALAYDNRGNVVASSPSGAAAGVTGPTVVTVDAAPAVALTSPLNGGVLLAGVPTPISAVASDTNLDQNGSPASITEVLFYQDGTLVGIATSPSSGNVYQTTFLPSPAPTGVVTSNITAVAVDSLGFSGTSTAASVTVAGSTGGGQIGTVITSPLPSNVPVGSSTVVTATSTSASGLIQRVEFFTDWNNNSGTGTKIGTSYAAPYAVIYTPAGPTGKVHLVKAMAYDSNGDYVSSIGGQDEVALTMVNPVSGGLPTCVITSPATASLVEIPDYISNSAAYLAVNVAAGTVATGSITQVQLYVNGSLYATDTNYPYTFKFTPHVTGPYNLVAIASDDHGNAIASSSTTYVNVPAPTTISVEAAPAVNITSPGDGQVLNSGAATSILASATDTNLDLNGNPVSITQVQFFQDGIFVGESSTPQSGNVYTTSFKPVQAFLNGLLIPSSLTAIASDSLGFTGTSPQVEVTVTAGGTGSNVVIGTPPTSTLLLPTNGQNVIVNTPVTFSATGYAANGNIQSVTFLVNGAVVQTSTAYPYTATYTFANLGTYSVEADVVDNVGDKTASTIARVTVVAEPPPVVNITAPTNGSIVTAGTGVSVTATASSPSGTISGVQFFANNIAIGTVAAQPYTVTFTPTSAGLYTITAIATDNVGEQTTSADSYFEAISATQGQGATVYTGTYSGGTSTDSGNFAFAVVDGSVGVYIGHAGTSADTASGGTPQFYSDIKVGSGGAFAATGLSGTTSPTGVSGTLLPGGEIYIGSASSSGGFSVASGYYSGSISGQPTSQVAAIVAPSGALMAYIGGSAPDVADGAVDSSGAFSITTIGGNSLSGTVDPTTGFLNAKLTGTGGGTVLAARVSGGTFSDGVMSNISTRGNVGTGSNVMIAGFVVSGTQTKPLLIRAVGPTLSTFGVSGVLAAPVLKVYNSAGVLIATNTGWGSNASAVTAADTQVGAFALPSGSADSALVGTFAPGSYTALVAGAGATSGVALVEAYDMSAPTPFNPNRLVNVSTRGTIASSQDLLIGGIVVTGSTPKRLLVRAVGPTLSGFGVSGALATPHLQLFDGNGKLIRENTTWQSGNDPVLVGNATTATGAFPLADKSADSALLIVLPPGKYTAQLSGSGSATGTGLVEAYEVP
jgi:hypothetical protein